MEKISDYIDKPQELIGKRILKRHATGGSEWSVIETIESIKRGTHFTIVEDKSEKKTLHSIEGNGSVRFGTGHANWGRSVHCKIISHDEEKAIIALWKRQKEIMANRAMLAKEIPNMSESMIVALYKLYQTLLAEIKF